MGNVEVDARSGSPGHRGYDVHPDYAGRLVLHCGAENITGPAEHRLHHVFKALRRIWIAQVGPETQPSLYGHRTHARVHGPDISELWIPPLAKERVICYHLENQRNAVRLANAHEPTVGHQTPGSGERRRSVAVDHEKLDQVFRHFLPFDYVSKTHVQEAHNFRSAASA